ncbi:MAG: hypothetical protein Kow0037_18410 [Calditrichia bacterium]
MSRFGIRHFKTPFNIPNLCKKLENDGITGQGEFLFAFFREIVKMIYREGNQKTGNVWKMKF